MMALGKTQTASNALKALKDWMTVNVQHDSTTLIHIRVEDVMSAA